MFFNDIMCLYDDKKTFSQATTLKGKIHEDSCITLSMLFKQEKIYQYVEKTYQYVKKYLCL